MITRGLAGRGLRNKLTLLFFHLQIYWCLPLVEPNWKPEDKGSQMMPTLFTGQLSGPREGGEGWGEVWRAVTISLVHLLTLFPPLGVPAHSISAAPVLPVLSSYSDSVCFLLLSKQFRCLAHIDCIAQAFCLMAVINEVDTAGSEGLCVCKY